MRPPLVVTMLRSLARMKKKKIIIKKILDSGFYSQRVKSLRDIFGHVPPSLKLDDVCFTPGLWLATNRMTTWNFNTARTSNMAG